MKRKSEQLGFTLIELLVVIAIIGILSAVGLIALNGARERARDVAKRSDIKQLTTALLLYHDANSNQYPASTLDGVTSWTTESSPQIAVRADSAGCPSCSFYNALVGNSKYIARLPTANASPSSGLLEQYWYISCDGDSTANQNVAQEYVLLTQLERPVDQAKNWWVFSSKTSDGTEVAPTGTPCM